MTGRIPPLTNFGGISTLFVMATEHEYGAHLRAVMTPLMIGVGPVEAGVAMGAALSALEAAGKTPDLVVSLGSAGSRTLQHAAIYQVGSVAYRDMDASALGFQKGETPFAGLPVILPVGSEIPDLPRASLATGASVVSGEGYDGIDADMVDMETFAVLRACQIAGVPMIGLRGISDGRDELSGLHDWTEYLALLDERMAACLIALKADIEAGRFKPSL